MPLRVGVIGAGHIGKIHLEAYRLCPEAEIVAVCDQQLERAKSAAERFGGKVYDSVPAMLAAEQLDSVSVATAGFENGSHHFEPVIQCLESGVHVLCEKPLSNDIQEARKMV